MRYTIALFIFCLSVNVFAQNEYTVESKVSSAVVYRSGALITRTAEVKLPKGQSKIHIPDLPESIQDESIRAWARGPGITKILDIYVDKKTAGAYRRPDVKRINKQIDSLTDIISDCNDKMIVLDMRRELIESLKAEPGRIAADKMSKFQPATKDWASMAAYIENRLSGILKQHREIVNTRESCERQTTALKLNLKESSADKLKTFKQVTIIVESDQEGRVTITPSYIIPSACWYPVYDARVFPSEKKTELSFYGMVQQSSGENWNDINLTLSTADPKNSTKLPEPSAWVIGIPFPRIAFDEVVRGGRSGEIITESDNSSYEAISVSKALSAVFSIAEPVSIPSDNSTHQTVIAVKHALTQLQYSAVPRVAPGVYLTGRIKNDFDIPILEGEMSIFVDNDFVNKIPCRYVPQGDTLNIELGIDDKLVCEKKMIYRKTETPGLFGTRKKVYYSFEISLANNRNTPVSLKLEDQIPVAQNEDIVVTLEELPGQGIMIDSDNILSWQINLKPGERRVIPVKYNVSFPQKMQVYGME